MRILFVIYDNESYIHCFPQGVAYIAAVLKKRGYEIEIYNQDIHHYPEEHLTEYLNCHHFDVVGVGVIGGYYQYRKLLKIAAAINDSKDRPVFILGGHGPSPEPAYFIKKTQADYVVIGEGEATMLELLEAIGNKKVVSNIKGIAYRKDNDVVVNERQPLIRDIDSLPFPAYELFPMEYYRLFREPHANASDFVFPVLSGRGCPFHCNFCYRIDQGFRPRSNESIIEEIKLLQRDYRINYINFSDELLMSSVSRIESLCQDFFKKHLNIKWSCNGRLNFAKKDILSLMKKAGCLFINYGIEAMDDQILKNMNKDLTTKQIIEGIEATLEVGISPGYNIIFGNIGENRETLNKGVEFLLKYDDCAQFRTIRPVTPYPGSALYYYALERGMLKNAEDFYEHKHLNSDLLAVNFTELTDEQFYEALLDANQRLITNYFHKKLADALQQTTSLYQNKDTSFRGFRHT
jgi:anaerobic magnesium-protoporphyrin IX monomethyl ester cyclase